MTDMPILRTCYPGQISVHLGKCYREEFESLCLKKKVKSHWESSRNQGKTNRRHDLWVFFHPWSQTNENHAQLVMHVRRMFSVSFLFIWERHLGPVGILHIVTQTILLSFVPSIYSHSKSVFRALMFLFRRITYVIQDLTVGQGEVMQTLNWYEGLCLAAHIWVKPRMKQSEYNHI